MADKQLARKRKLEAARRQHFNAEMVNLRRVVDEAEPQLAVPMQQADVLEQARLLIGKLQSQVADLEQQLRTTSGDWLAAYNLGRQHLASELLAAQLQLQQLQQAPQPPTTEPTDPEDAQME
ncbi:hypothetical protein M3Y94_00029800 [Aphelenchoides besseyi]|nr:hypothetical protein M3Y94_00029800 [Aphelenchoides besseyi]